MSFLVIDIYLHGEATALVPCLAAFGERCNSRELRARVVVRVAHWDLVGLVRGGYLQAALFAAATIYRKISRTLRWICKVTRGVVELETGPRTRSARSSRKRQIRNELGISRARIGYDSVDLVSENARLNQPFVFCCFLLGVDVCCKAVALA